MATNDTTAPTSGEATETIAPGVGMAHTTVVPENLDPDDADGHQE